MNRKLAIGFALIAIGLMVSLLAIFAVEETKRAVSDCIQQAVLEQQCGFIGGWTIVMYLIIFTLGFPIAGIALVISNLRSNNK